MHEGTQNAAESRTKEAREKKKQRAGGFVYKRHDGGNKKNTLPNLHLGLRWHNLRTNQSLGKAQRLELRSREGLGVRSIMYSVLIDLNSGMGVLMRWLGRRREDNREDSEWDIPPNKPTFYGHSGIFTYPT